MAADQSRPHPLRRCGVYLLRPLGPARARGYLPFTITQPGIAERNCLLPTAGSLPFFLIAGASGTTISHNPDDATLQPASWAGALHARLRRRNKGLQAGVLNFDQLEIFPAGPKHHYKAYCRQVRTTREHQTAPDSELLRAHPELITGWPARTPKAPAMPQEDSPRIAVALHLYYTDLWPEIETLLGRWTLPFKLFLTLTKENHELSARVAAVFPGSVIRIVENSGRDVRPFLLLLESGCFDSFDLICKIHGKKSISHGRIAAFGDIWRRASFLDLLATDTQLKKVIAFFANNPQCGIAGPGRFLLSSTSTAPRNLLGKNHAAATALAVRMGSPLDDNALDFFAGTMFWVRPQALAPLRRLHLTESFGPAQTPLEDGAIEHAIERLFNHAARAAGFQAAALAEDRAPIVFTQSLGTGTHHCTSEGIKT